MISKIINLLTSDVQEQYFENQLYQLETEIKALDSSWVHSKIVYEYLADAVSEIKSNQEWCHLIPKKMPNYERRIEKYMTWIEVLRLVNYQYGRYSDLCCSFSEGLYASLCDLTAKYCDPNDKAQIAVIGCGPGRTVADMAIMFPNCTIWGLDYSYLSLKIAEKILVSRGETYLFPYRDITTGDAISSLMMLHSFGLNNVKLGLFDIMQPQPTNNKYDLIICSNTINLLPNHEIGIGNLVSLLSDGGKVVFADLIGWRLDREVSQRSLNSLQSIKKLFGQFGVYPIECYRGGPYIEQEGDSRTEYMENFYVGEKK